MAYEICITDRGSFGDRAADTVQAEETQTDANLAAGGVESRANSRESGACPPAGVGLFTLFWGGKEPKMLHRLTKKTAGQLSSRRFFVESVLRRCWLFEGAEKESKTE